MSTDTARKAIFITGAASGIGRATARLFAGEGWFVGCFDRNGGALEDLKAEIGEARGLFQPLDVTDHAAFKLVLDAFSAASGGRMDVLHNNAGIIAEGAFGDMPWDTVMGIVNVNLVAVMFGIHAALPLLKATPGSLCFTTCSASAIFGTGGIAAYSATKHAVRGLTEALSVELHGKGVRAADVLPGLDAVFMGEATRYALETGMGETLLVKQQNRADRPLLRPGEPALVAWAVHDTRLVG